MKKLMIAAAIVCAAAMSQAAEFKWTTGKLYHFQAANDLTGLVDGQAYTALNSGTKGYVDNLNNATWTFVMTLSQGGESVTLPETDLTTFSSHKVGQMIDTDFFELPTDESTKTYTYDIVITGNYKDANGKEWTLTSNHITGSAEYTKMSDLALATGVATSWTVAAVPEPTSGLLLLLGVAGLALRRRRA